MRIGTNKSNLHKIMRVSALGRGLFAACAQYKNLAPNLLFGCMETDPML